MTFNCDQIVIFDLEATCWEGREHFHKYREVIALGACILDLKTLEISGNFKTICKPIKSEISEYCTKLTGITKEMTELFGETFEYIWNDMNNILEQFSCTFHISHNNYFDLRKIIKIIIFDKIS